MNFARTKIIWFFILSKSCKVQVQNLRTKSFELPKLPLGIIQTLLQDCNKNASSKLLEHWTLCCIICIRNHLHALTIRLWVNCPIIPLNIRNTSQPWGTADSCLTDVKQKLNLRTRSRVSRRITVYSSRLQGYFSPWTKEKLMPMHPSTQADNLKLRISVSKVEALRQGMNPQP